MRLYLDSSAVVKLVQRERESDALRRYLRRNRGDAKVTSALSHVEVIRAVAMAGPSAVEQARRQLSRIDQIVLSAELLERAAMLAPGSRLRSLDAVHIASAQTVGDQLRAVVTYDSRMADAAASIGITVDVPR